MNTTRKVTIYALSTALVCLSTMAIQIPIPLGYIHPGNALILLTAFLFGPGAGAAAAGPGSALADLVTGFAYWSLPTLLIKGIMGFIAGLVTYRLNKSHKVYSIKTLLGALAAVAVMIAGYFIAGSIIYGSIFTGALQIPGLVTEGLIGAGLFFLMASALDKAGFNKYAHRFLS